MKRHTRLQAIHPKTRITKEVTGLIHPRTNRKPGPTTRPAPGHTAASGDGSPKVPSADSPTEPIPWLSLYSPRKPAKPSLPVTCPVFSCGLIGTGSLGISRASQEAREIAWEEPEAVVGAVSPARLLPGQAKRRRAPSRSGRRPWIVSGTGFTPSLPGCIQISAHAGPSACRNGGGAVIPTSSVPERASLGRSLCARSSVSCRSCVTGEKPGPACAVSSDCAVSSVFLPGSPCTT